VREGKGKNKPPQKRGKKKFGRKAPQIPLPKRMLVQDMGRERTHLDPESGKRMEMRGGGILNTRGKRKSANSSKGCFDARSGGNG